MTAERRIHATDFWLGRSPWRRCRAVLMLALALWLQSAVAGQASTTTGGTTESTQVRMYVLPNCGYCDRARQHLQARGIGFVEEDIAADPQAKADFDALGGAGTPLLVIDDQLIHGLDPNRIDAALAGWD